MNTIIDTPSPIYIDSNNQVENNATIIVDEQVEHNIVNGDKQVEYNVVDGDEQVDGKNNVNVVDGDAHFDDFEKILAQQFYLRIRPQNKGMLIFIGNEKVVSFLTYLLCLIIVSLLVLLLICLPLYLLRPIYTSLF